jgi:hypothetical protein
MEVDYHKRSCRLYPYMWFRTTSKTVFMRGKRPGSFADLVALFTAADVYWYWEGDQKYRVGSKVVISDL